MRVFRNFRFKSAKTPTATERLGRAFEMLHANGWSGCETRFYFEQMEFINKTGQPYHPVDACARLVQRFPQMRPFYTRRPSRVSDGMMRIVSNITSEWSEWGNDTSEALVDPALILEIAKGIPRSFPLKDVAYVIDRIPWGRPAGAWEPSNCLTLNHSWWISGRRNWFNAHVELPIDSAITRLPEAPVEVRACLARFGAIRSVEVVAYRSQEEERQLSAADDRSQRLRDEILAEQTTERFLQTLPEHLSRDASRGPSTVVLQVGQPIRFKKLISARVKPLGYRHAGKLGFVGVIVFSKLTQNNNLILLEFHFGWWCFVSCTMHVKGPMWDASVEVRFTDQFQYAIFAADTFERVMANIASTLPWLEDTFVKGLEQIYGPAPAWFRYFA